MSGTFLELIETQRERVQSLRTHLLIALALQEELDERTSGHILTFDNTTIHWMAIDHRLGLARRLASWARAFCGTGGFLDQVIAAHLHEVRAPHDDGKERGRILYEKMRELFERRFPAAAKSGTVTAADIEAVRQGVLESAAPFLAHCDASWGWLDDASGPEPTPIALSVVRDFVVAAEELVNDFRRSYDGAIYGFSDHEAHPAPRDAAKDLVDLVLLGSVDRLISVTGVNDRLGANGAWWWEHRGRFWEALAKVAKERPDVSFNDPELISAAATRVEIQSLTTPQIERLVSRYRLEYARYEAAVRFVEDQLRRFLGRERIKALIGGRAKDPDSLRGKLERKRSKYEYQKLEANLASVVTDLAGVRVILYDYDQADLVVTLIKNVWTVISDEPKTGGAYQARHITIELRDSEQRAIDGAVCEIQLTALASHAFNELEHDITYKDHDVQPGTGVKAQLEVLRSISEALDKTMRQLLTTRREELGKGKTEITSGRDLGTILDGTFGRRLSGDFDALLWLWQGVEPAPLTRQLVERNAPMLRQRAAAARNDLDDATMISFSLWLDAPLEAVEIAREYSDQNSELIRAILRQSAPDHAP